MIKDHWQEGNWVFGGIERITGQSFFVKVQQRDANTLLPMVSILHLCVHRPELYYFPPTVLDLLYIQMSGTPTPGCLLFQDRITRITR